MTTKELILKLLNENKEAFTITQINDSYIYPDIPNKKLRNAKAKYELGVKDEILWLGDRTLFGSAKDNVAITEYVLFSNTIDFLYVIWSDLIRVELSAENKALYFIMNEYDEEKNVLFPLSDFGLEDDNEQYIDTYISVFNQIAEAVINEKQALFDEISEQFEKENFKEVVEQSGQFIKEHKEYDELYFETRQFRVISFMRLDDFSTALREIDTTIKLWDKENESVYPFLYQLRGDIYNNLGKPYEALQNYTIALNNMEDEDEEDKHEITDTIKETYQTVKDNFSSYNYQDRKIIVIDDKLSDLTSNNYKVLRKNELPNIKFPVGHPIARELYVGHPHKKNIYRPLASYEDDLFLSRFNEFSYFIQCLGAKKLSIKNVRGHSTNKVTEEQLNVKANVNIGFVDANGAYNSEKELAEDMSLTKKIARIQVFSPAKMPFKPDGLVWYEHEQTWQQLFQQRLNGNILRHSEKISSVQNKVISSNELREIQADFENLLASVGVSFSQEIKQNFKEREVTEWEIDIEFAPIAELTGENNNKQIQATNDISENEQNYIEEIKFMLEDDGIIDDDERRMLKRKQKKYEISDKRAKELEEQFTPKEQFSTEELEYIEEIKMCVEENGKLTSGDERILKRFASKLKISDERATELINTVLNNETKQYTPEEEKYIEEIKFYLEDDGEISPSEKRMLNRERDKLKISEKRADELEQEFTKQITK